MECVTNSAAETQALAKKIINELIKSRQPAGALILCLEGELGAGKTTFTQGLAQALGVKDRILSPTFVIMKRFNVKLSPGRFIPSEVEGSRRVDNLYHIDCYRLTGPQDMKELGFEEIIKNPQNIVVIEWPEKIKKILPADVVWLKLKHVGEDKRKILIENLV